MPLGCSQPGSVHDSNLNQLSALLVCHAADVEESPRGEGSFGEEHRKRRETRSGMAAGRAGGLCNAERFGLSLPHQLCVSSVDVGQTCHPQPHLSVVGSVDSAAEPMALFVPETASALRAALLLRRQD